MRLGRARRRCSYLHGLLASLPLERRLSPPPLMLADIRAYVRQHHQTVFFRCCCGKTYRAGMKRDEYAYFRADKRGHFHVFSHPCLSCGASASGYARSHHR